MIDHRQILLIRILKIKCDEIAGLPSGLIANVNDYGVNKAVQLSCDGDIAR